MDLAIFDYDHSVALLQLIDITSVQNSSFPSHGLNQDFIKDCRGCLFIDGAEYVVEDEDVRSAVQGSGKTHSSFLTT